VAADILGSYCRHDPIAISDPVSLLFGSYAREIGERGSELGVVVGAIL
jgi:hypothetical protein